MPVGSIDGAMPASQAFDYFYAALMSGINVGHGAFKNKLVKDAGRTPASPDEKAKGGARRSPDLGEVGTEGAEPGDRGARDAGRGAATKLTTPVDCIIVLVC